VVIVCVRRRRGPSSLRRGFGVAVRAGAERDERDATTIGLFPRACAGSAAAATAETTRARVVLAPRGSSGNIAVDAMRPSLSLRSRSVDDKPPAPFARPLPLLYRIALHSDECVESRNDLDLDLDFGVGLERWRRAPLTPRRRVVAPSCPQND